MAPVLERSFRSSSVNELVNRDDIRPHVGGDVTQKLDLSAAIENDNNIALMGKHGGFVLIWTSPRTYEVHTMIAEAGRGEWALAAAREGMRQMRDQYGAARLWTRVNPSARNVRTFTIAAGFRPCGQQVFDIGSGPEVFNLYEVTL